MSRLDTPIAERDLPHFVRAYITCRHGSMTWRRKYVLSTALLDRLTAFGSQLGQCDREADEILTDLAALPPSLIVRASYDIAFTCGFYAKRPRQSLLRLVVGGSDPSEHELLQRHAAYAWLFLFHADGHLREAALDAIREPPPSPFLFAALAWRLNDWVAPVRQAAQRCAERVIARTAPDVAKGVAVYLLDRHLVWGRWSDEAKLLDPMFARQDVMAGIAAHLARQATGPMPWYLRQSLRYPAFDDHLAELATTAIQPEVRAYAYRCLITGEVAWPAGYQWVWIDKTRGIKRWILKRETRAIQSRRAISDVINDAVRDRSALVRKTVADALIAARPRLRDHEALILDVIDLLENDRSTAVRSRADFMRRHPPGT